MTDYSQSIKIEKEDFGLSIDDILEAWQHVQSQELKADTVIMHPNLWKDILGHDEYSDVIDAEFERPGINNNPGQCIQLFLPGQQLRFTFGEYMDEYGLTKWDYYV